MKVDAESGRVFGNDWHLRIAAPKPLVFMLIDDAVRAQTISSQPAFKGARVAVRGGINPHFVALCLKRTPESYRTRAQRFMPTSTQPLGERVWL